MTTQPRGLLPKPFRLWLPRLDAELAYSESRRDLKRARMAWRGHWTVWGVPWFERERNWRLGKNELNREIGLPSECEEQIDVLHVSTTGIVYGNWMHRFEKPNISGLLESWLNYFHDGKRLQVRPVPETFQFPMPEERGDLIGLNDEMVLKRRIGTVLPSAENGEFSVGGGWRRIWPFEGASRIVVEPDEEIRQSFESARVQIGADNRATQILKRDEGAGESGARVTFLWEKPFDRLFPFGSGLGSPWALMEMLRILELSSVNYWLAMHEAQTVSTELLASGSAALREIWLFQKLAEVGLNNLLVEIEGRFDMSFSTLEEACASDRFQQTMTEIVDVQECLGVLGFLWALFIHALRSGSAFVSCERCGRYVRARRRTKRYCNRQDHLECYRARRAADRRRERRVRDAPPTA